MKHYRPIYWVGFVMLAIGAGILAGHSWRFWVAWLLAYWAGTAMQMGRNTDD